MTDLPLATPFRPDWSTRPRVEYKWRTGVFRARRGAEQRWSERQAPRIEVSFDHLALNAAESERARRFLRAHQAKPIAMRDFRAQSDAAIQADGSLSLSDPARFMVGQLVEVSTRGVSHAARISTIVGEVITLDPGLPDGFPAYAEVFSCLVGVLDDEIAVEQITDAVHRIKIKASSLPGFDSFAMPTAGAGADQLGIPGSEIFPLRHNFTDSLEISYTRTIEEIDFEVGRRRMWDVEGVGAREATYQVLSMSAKECDDLIAFAFRVQGRLLPFTALPSEEDFPTPVSVTPVIEGGALCHRFELPDGSDPMLLQPDWSPDPQRLLLSLSAGRKAYAVRVFPSVHAPDPGLYRITDIFNDRWQRVGGGGSAISVEDIEGVQITPLFRMSSDNVTLEYLSDSIISCKVIIQELVDNRG